MFSIRDIWKLQEQTTLTTYLLHAHFSCWTLSCGRSHQFIYYTIDHCCFTCVFHKQEEREVLMQHLSLMKATCTLLKQSRRPICTCCYIKLPPDVILMCQCSSSAFKTVMNVSIFGGACQNSVVSHVVAQSPCCHCNDFFYYHLASYSSQR